MFKWLKKRLTTKKIPESVPSALPLLKEGNITSEEPTPSNVSPAVSSSTKENLKPEVEEILESEIKQEGQDEGKGSLPLKNPPGSPPATVNSKQQEWFDKSKVSWFDNDGKLIPPKEHQDNLEYRVWLRGLEDPGVDDDHKIKAGLLKRCKDGDVHFFFNSFLWTQDPRRHPADLPFITYDYEDAYITWLMERIKGAKDGLIEKSRDMGISWTTMGVLLYCWMFWTGFKGHIGSKKEDDVDRSGDIRSLFEKLRYLIRELPDWLKPYGFEMKKNSMFMRVINPYNDNAITGESANRDFGRAGRYKCLILDEFAFMEYGEEAWTGSGDSSPCRIALSTPNGTGNKFWQLRFKSKIKVFTSHWTMHPIKAEGVTEVSTKNKLTREQAFEKWSKGEKVTSPWYEAEKNRRLTQETQSKVDIAQELDIDYIASGDPYFDIDTLKKQTEWTLTEQWLGFGRDQSKKVIIGTITEIDGKLEFRPNPNGWLRLFETPKQVGQYVGALDSAEGLEHGDFSAGAFRDKKTRNLVAGIYGHYDYDELAFYGYLTARWYNSCLVGAEAGGYGAAVNKRLYDLGANVVRAIDYSSGGNVERDKLGWINSTASRPRALGDMEAEIREDGCELRDKDLITECFNFVNKNGKPQASEGSMDDYIWAFCIAGQFLRLNPYSTEVERTYKQGERKSAGTPPSMNMGYSFSKKK